MANIRAKKWTETTGMSIDAAGKDVLNVNWRISSCRSLLADELEVMVCITTQLNLHIAFSNQLLQLPGNWT
jgi:hypothetical protein